jgi:type IX secretion system PorP/SprF family membrane protein
MKKVIFFAVCFCGGVILSRAQDVHFSQFYASPLSLNPTLAGNFGGDLRVAGNFRSQWRSVNKAFTTGTASVDGLIGRGVLPENDKWGLGVLGLSDASGDGILKRNVLSVVSAYHKALDDEDAKFLSVGFQASFSNLRLDLSKALFSDMLTASGFTQVSLDPLQQNSVPSVGYVDFGTGLLYSGKIGEESRYYVGASLYHINKPIESFLDKQFVLNRRLSIHGSGSFLMSEYFSLHTNLLYQRQGKAMEVLAGGAAGYALSDVGASSFYTGIWTRFSNTSNDALIPYMGLEYGSFLLGISYDVNVSKFATASIGRGGGEISLIYVKQGKGLAKQKGRLMHCPRF